MNNKQFYVIKEELLLSILILLILMHSWAFFQKKQNPYTYVGVMRIPHLIDLLL